MAYVTPRPSSTTPQPPNPPTHQGSGDSTGLSFSTSQAPNHVPSPIDWANFMNFQTPPGPPGVSGGRSLGSGSQQGDNRGKPDEQYAAFAQGIAISRSSPQNISFQHPYPPPSPSRHNQQNTPQQPQYVPSPSPLQLQLQLPTEQNIAQRSPSNANMQSPPAGQSTGKGKSVSRQTSNAAQPQPNPSNSISQSQPSSNDLDNGLALDPSAFSRDIRFQVPPFLSNQMTGAPTFPPGGEAWSGFSGANFFSSGAGGQGQPAPGQLFGQPYDAQKGFNDNEASGGGRHVLNGLNGFMGGDGGWDSWMNGEQKDGVGMGTTFYVNPNPSTDVVAKNNQRQPNGSGSARSNLPQLNMNSSQIGNNVAQSPRTASTAQPSHMSSPTTGSSTQRRSTANPSPRTCASAGSMQTSAILPQVGYAPLTFPSPSSTTFPFAPSINQSSASTINIASSSTAPYAPPSNTQALLQGPGVIGPSLSDGPGLYSTTGFDMVGVLSRVAARKDPKTVLGPVDLSCSFLVVVSRLEYFLNRPDNPSGHSQIRCADSLCQSHLHCFDGI